ncbi:MAG: Nif3-like dinuclear metal center hexameric protein [Clostridium sp.]
MKCSKLCSIIEGEYPLQLREDYDNVGLLLGKYESNIEKVLVALEITPKVIDEAINCGVDIIVTHHPLIFKPLKKITDNGYIESMVIKLIENKIALYSSHTNFDSSKNGMNDILADKIGLVNIKCLDSKGDTDEGIGRFGSLENSLSFKELYTTIKEKFNLSRIIVSGSDETSINKVAVVGGSGGDLIKLAMKKGCKCIITGDVKHHAALDFSSQGMCIVDLTHYASEIIFKEHFSSFLKKNTDIEVIVSKVEENPLRIV